MSVPHHHVMSRRGFCTCCVVAAGATALGGWLTPAQAFVEARDIVDLVRADAAKRRITVHSLRRGVSILEGSGGNIAVLTGPDGNMFVDAGITVSRLRILEAVKGLSRQPITHLINTHWHFDHTDGNQWLNQDGATIIAHENTHKHLLAAQRVEDWDYNFPTAPLSAVPSELVASEKTLSLNGATIALLHPGPAHTDGDLTVTFGEADVLHCGDIYWNGIYPFIDYSTGGSIDGTIKAAEAILAAATSKTIIIPGHGKPVSNRAELAAYRDMLADIRGTVATLKRQGRPVDDIVAAKPTAAHDAQWGQFLISPAFFTRLVYQGV
ncbi:glyoxylase-like metal-dependent hydrolase (beta-lactamase superfamily II) [Inquilinus ginsengisoli]|jgi:glyoxylase-like metal-dependent hydrolase (beta-lactamase superfamily II)|uniref:Glyoxylase-like metal-dependent hydrolase (Beta-lactamase superfamily II) n=1 Tax=Inquilinus ginsengisoli TaxID=363840 RepID=A0ABU1JS67_9PROT|nr:MBL fold metallo-hydrolase [Inquilinus ginsengisoli]MDR6291467.1 glyoxylase-like metal-dependent hydrolase (beta-lactamase superfamily II) [Inquilinus ginsengisoli]